MSLAAGWRHYADVSRQHATAQAATRAQWLQQPKKNPHSAAHYGVYAFKPKSQLAMVDTGIDPYVGVAVWLEAHKQNEFKYRPAQDRTAVQRFGEMTGRRDAAGAPAAVHRADDVLGVRRRARAGHAAAAR